VVIVTALNYVVVRTAPLQIPNLRGNSVLLQMMQLITIFRSMHHHGFQVENTHIWKMYVLQ
jgi:hypothetical protein